jgi:hypothetical protein
MAVREKTPLHTETSTSTIRTIATTDTPIAPHVAGLYEGFLELPVPVVLLSLWLVGAALIGLSILTLYYLFWLIVELLVGL